MIKVLFCIASVSPSGLLNSSNRPRFGLNYQWTVTGSGVQLCKTQHPVFEFICMRKSFLLSGWKSNIVRLEVVVLASPGRAVSLRQLTSSLEVSRGISIITAPRDRVIFVAALYHVDPLQPNEQKRPFCILIEHLTPSANHCISNI